MYRAKVHIWDCFVVGYSDSGPIYEPASASGTAINRSPKKAVELAFKECLRAFRPQIPDWYYNRVDGSPLLTLYKGTTLLCEQYELE